MVIYHDQLMNFMGLPTHPRDLAPKEPIFLKRILFLHKNS